VSRRAWLRVGLVGALWGASYMLIKVAAEDLSEAADRMPGIDTVGALLLLGIGGTGLTFVVFYALLSDIGPTRSSIAGYLAPGFALMYGASILGEPLTVAGVAGLVLILGGSWLVAERRMPRWLGRSPAPEPEPEAAPAPAGGPR
jgi:drug/metabolite transporter (DMT)-like permease